MAYAKIESNKLEHFNFEDFIYSHVRSSVKYQYLRCTLYRNLKCKDFGKIDLTLNQFIQTQDHNHEVDAYKTKQIALRNKLKRAAETSSSRLRDIFDDTCRNDPEATQISYRYTRCIISKEENFKFLVCQNLQMNLANFYSIAVIPIYINYSNYSNTICINCKG